MLVRTCGHIAICNSEALRLGGIDEKSPTPQGELIEQQNGRLTGLLAESARAPVRAAIPAATEEDLIAGIERGGRYLLSLGITSCMDAAVGQRAASARSAPITAPSAMGACRSDLVDAAGR